MRSPKVRCQLFLPGHLSRRLDTIATGSGKHRSELLVDAVEAWLERRDAPSDTSALMARLERVDRASTRLARNYDLIWECLSAIVRHQMISAAALPPVDPATRALGERRHAAFLDEVARRVATVPADFSFRKREEEPR